MRGQRSRTDGRPEHEIDENFWAQAAANQAAGRSGAEDIDASKFCMACSSLVASSVLPSAQEGDILFSRREFFQDDDDAPGFDDVFDNDGAEPITVAEPGEQDLLASTQQRRRVRPETVNYAKRAKRVDVRKLKENIWKNLDIVVPEKQDENAMVCTFLKFVPRLSC